MPKLTDLFSVEYGNKFDLNKMNVVPRSRGGVNFVGRSSRNHGVSGFVSPIDAVPPYEAGLITVALGGTKLLCSFIQDQPFYTAQNVAVLSPKREMTFAEKLYVCLCIRHNRFKYSAFGREANRTLKDLVIPDVSEAPTWIKSQEPALIDKISLPANTAATPILEPNTWVAFRIDSLFNIKKGKRLTKANQSPGKTPFIGAVDKNNGVSALISNEPNHSANTITVNYNGSVGEAFYQPVPFWASDDVNVLYPKFKMTPEIGIFVAAIIRQDKYRYNFGRKWHVDRMKQSTISLPIDKKGKPDWLYMENYIKSLSYSSQISHA
jgi:hypothetical protein